MTNRISVFITKLKGQIFGRGWVIKQLSTIGLVHATAGL